LGFKEIGIRKEDVLNSSSIKGVIVENI